jgi:hypothetical protein
MIYQTDKTVKKKIKQYYQDLQKIRFTNLNKIVLYYPVFHSTFIYHN